MRLARRSVLDGALDRLRFRLDTFPELDYQPLPWLGMDEAKRSAGVESRWAAMSPLIDDLGVKTAVDIGANVGFFSISLAKRGIVTVAVENDPRFTRTLYYAIRKLELENLGLLIWSVSKSNVENLPKSDCAVFLSVWHHIVRYQGLADATQFLERLWSQTSKVLFFETGEGEMPPEYNLPFAGREAIGNYLAGTCPGGRLEFLGKHQAFDPSGGQCDRNVFAVIRT